MAPDIQADPAVAPAGPGALVEVLPSTLGALGYEGWDNSLGLPAAGSYVVLLVDGLGWNLLRRHRDEAPYLCGLADAGRPIPVGVPSTTATSLTGLGTALPAGAHGVVGFTSRVPGTNRLLDALRWDSRVDPLEWQPHRTVFERAAGEGVPVSVVSRRAFAKSGLTACGQRGADYLGADLEGERVSVTATAAAVPGSLTYAYVGELDAAGHRNGCRSWAWRYQLSAVDSFAEMLRSALPPSAALVVVADHGMVDVDMADRIDVDAEPELLEGVTIVGGEARLRHLYCAAASADSVADRWRDRLADRAVVLTKDQAIELGWFGPVEASVRPRLGDVIVASLADTAVVSTERFGYEATLVGLHGSITPDEILIPLLISAPDT